MNRLTASSALLCITSGYTIHCLVMKGAIAPAGFLLGFAIGAYVLHLKRS